MQSQPTREELLARVDSLTRQISDVYPLVSLGRLLAGVLHEINNPLGSILSNNGTAVRALAGLEEKLIELARHGEPPTPRVLETVETLAGLAAVDRLACERISSLVRSLKTFTRSGLGQRRRIQLNDLVRDAVRLAEAQFRDRIELAFQPTSLPEVECYPPRLSQVMLNLLLNAGQAIAGKGRIEVRTLCESAGVVIEVQDNGCGIPPELRGRIFERGFTTKPLGVGSGLGLAISREIITVEHNGTISFESAEGAGTTFRIGLPFS
jgi:signal transduction histidine kinase